MVLSLDGWKHGVLKLQVGETHDGHDIRLYYVVSHS